MPKTYCNVDQPHFPEKQKYILLRHWRFATCKIYQEFYQEVMPYSNRMALGIGLSSQISLPEDSSPLLGPTNT